MAITVKDIGEILGLKDIDETKATAEEIKSALDEKFVSREHAHKDEGIRNAIVGKTLGSIRTKAKKLFEFDSKEIEKKDIEDILEEVNTKFESKLKEAKEAGGQGKDKRVSDLEILVADKDKSIAAYKTGLEEKEAKINELTNSYTENLKNYKTGHKLDEIKSKLPFVEDYSKKEVLRTGFESMVKSKYKFNLNDKEELEVFTTDGNPIKHPKKTGEFLKPDELLMQLAEEQGLIKKNNASDKNKPVLIIPGYNDKDAGNNNGQNKSKVHAKARAKAEGATT